MFSTFFLLYEHFFTFFKKTIDKKLLFAYNKFIKNECSLKNSFKNIHYKDKNIRNIVDEIKNVNNMTSSDLKINQELKIKEL